MRFRIHADNLNPCRKKLQGLVDARKCLAFNPLVLASRLIMLFERLLETLATRTLLGILRNATGSGDK